MKPRKSQLKLRKSFFFPPWRISIFHRGVSDFLGGVNWRLARVIGAIGVHQSYRSHLSDRTSNLYLLTSNF